MKKFVVAITGASGAPYSIGLIKELVKMSEVHLVVTPVAHRIIKAETGLNWAGRTEQEIQDIIRNNISTENIFYWSSENMDAPVASGSFQIDAMLVVPCSMKTLSGIAHGYASTLVERSADVTIKEGRPLLLAPREMPFSAIHLENMLSLARLGVKIMPPVPAFYHNPKGLGDIVDFVVGRMLDMLGVEHSMFNRWEGDRLAHM